jgi:hypothetical protein
MTLRAKKIFSSQFGSAFRSDALYFMQKNIKDDSVDLILTSPPFPLLRKKKYGNEDQEKFKNLSRKRITKINQGIESLGRLSQKSNYSYSEDQITKLFDEIYDSLALTKSKFGIENVRLVSHEENTKKIELESLKDKAEKLIKEIESLKDR